MEEAKEVRSMRFSIYWAGSGILLSSHRELTQNTEFTQGLSSGLSSLREFIQWTPVTKEWYSEDC